MLMVFCCMAFVGAGVLALVMMFGGDSDVELDFDDIGFGGRWLSFRGLMSLMTGLGAGGGFTNLFIRQSEALTNNQVIAYSWLGAVVGGLLIAIPVNMLMWWLLKQQVTSTFNASSFVGMTGTVSTDIRAGGSGKVRIESTAGNFERVAQCDDPAVALPYGTPVEILHSDAGMVIVRRKNLSTGA